MLDCTLRAIIRAVALASVVLFPLAAAAAAASKPFAGPSSWDHTVSNASTDAALRRGELWKSGDGEILTLLSDGGPVYDDVMSAVRKNAADNGIRPSLDRDRTCEGRRAHEVEMTYTGYVVRQLIFDDAPGVTRLTFMRPSAVPAARDAVAALDAYCAS